MLCFGQQVDMETGEQFMCLNAGEGNFQCITETASPRASNSFSSWNLGIPLVQKEDETDLLSETSKSTSNDSEDIGIIEDNQIENAHEGEISESPPRETVSLLSATVGSNTDHNTENEELVSTHVELVVPSSQDDGDVEKPVEHDLEIGEKTSEDVGDECDQKEPMEEEEEKRAAKRPRLSSSTGEAEEK